MNRNAKSNRSISMLGWVVYGTVVSLVLTLSIKLYTQNNLPLSFIFGFSAVCGFYMTLSSERALAARHLADLFWVSYHFNPSPLTYEEMEPSFVIAIFSLGAVLHAAVATLTAIICDLLSASDLILITAVIGVAWFFPYALRPLFRQVLRLRSV